MTVPALPDHEPDELTIRPLPDYEPDESGPPVRWSSLRPAAGPQLRLVSPPPESEGPPVAPAALAQVLRLVL